MLTPPVVTSRSASASAPSIAARTAALRSGTTGWRRAGQPACRTAAASIRLLDSQIRPGVTGCPGSASSFPVEITVILGRGRTVTTP